MGGVNSRSRGGWTLQVGMGWTLGAGVGWTGVVQVWWMSKQRRIILMEHR